MPGTKRIAIIACAFFMLAVVFAAANSSVASTMAEGEALFEAEKYEDAKKLFQKLSKNNPQDSRSYYYLGRIAREEQETDDAIDYFKKAIEIEETSDYYVWLGDTYVVKVDEVNFLKKKGIAGKIKDAFTKAVELDPENVEARASLAGFYMEAPGFAGGSKDKAREHIEVLKKLDPLEGADSAAQLYQKEEKYDLAEKEFLVLCNGTAEDAQVYYRIGFMYQNGKKWEDAVRAFEKSLEVDPNDGSALYQIGRTGVLSKQELDRAEAAFRGYLERKPHEDEPGWADAHWRLGMLYEIRHNEELARAEYEAALSLEPDHKQAKKALKKIKRR